MNRSVDKSNNDPAGLNRQGNWHALKATLHRQLLESMDLFEVHRLPVEQLRKECTHRINTLMVDQRMSISGPEKDQLLREVLDEVFGLGPLEVFFRDPHVSDILINGPDQIYIEVHGRLQKTSVRFRDEKHLIQVIQRVAANVGRRIDESSPMLDARLRDGSRVNAIIPPLALDGPAMSIRRFGTDLIDVNQLIQLKTLTPEMFQFLRACVQSRLNILISGGTGAGKTTLLNILSRWIPNNERVITIEDAAELRLQQEHAVRLETRPPNIEGVGEITQRELLRNALRMRPDRIIIGEVRGPEALDMLQAMNTGHEGSMTTVHSNNPRDATRRVENMVSMAGLNYPVRVIRQQMSSALNILVHISRLTGGKRKIVSICEITGMEGEQFCLQELFKFVQSGVGQDGNAAGSFEACGARPHVLTRILAEGIELPPDLFHRRELARI